MENITNLKIGDIFYSPVTKKTYEVCPATSICAGCAFHESHLCWDTSTLLGVTGINCAQKIYKEMEVKSTNCKDYWTPGNIVIMEDETRYYIINDSLAVGLKGTISKSCYNNDGTDSWGDKYGIKAIAKHCTGCYGKGFEYNLTKDAESYEEVVWAASNIKEMTVAELEEKLGLVSGTLRIKK